MDTDIESENGFWVRIGRPQIDLFCNPLEHLKGRGWHEVGSYGAWDLNRLVDERKAHLVHSSLQNEVRRRGKFTGRWQKLYFKPAENLFVAFHAFRGDDGNLSVWSADPKTANAEFMEWCTRYRKEPKRERNPAEFYIVTASDKGLDAQEVPLTRRFPAREEDLALHYGQDFPEWIAEFVRNLKEQRFGATILRGDPGTGKTSFIRHLIHKLRRSHRFYYLPVDHADLLSSPKIVDFWAMENVMHKKKRKVVILEDAESLLVQRGRDNHASLSNLLNIADGLLGEFLQLHLICTINCDIDKLDPAMTRGGRLLEYRHFRRLNAREAQRLAAAKGLSIPTQEDYSLAEIYNGRNRGPDAGRDKTIGFT